MSLTTRGSAMFMEYFGEVTASELSLSNNSWAGDMYVKIKEPRIAWYYARLLTIRLFV
jgi:hypothetical protein